MAFTYKPVNCQEIKKATFIVARNIVVLLILIYCGASLVICEEEIPFCKDHLKELVKDEDDWSKRCLKYEGHKIDSSCCEIEKEYLRKRMCMLSKMCFHKGNDCRRRRKSSYSYLKYYLKVKGDSHPKCSLCSSPLLRREWTV